MGTETEVYHSTRQAARKLALNPATLAKAVYDGRLPEPPRGPGNVRLWRLADIETACWFFYHKSLEARQRELEGYAAKAAQGREVQP